MKEKIYLDSAASTIIDDRVVDAMILSLREDFGNPSATHSFGQQVKSKIETVRKNIAKWLNVPANEIIFTSGSTESNNFILRSSVDNLGITRIITSPLEHKSVLETVKDIKEKHPKVDLIFLPVKNKKGDLNYEKLEELLKDESKPTLVTLMHGNNEIGNLMDLKAVAKLCKAHNAFFHSDTVQTLAHIPLDFSDIPIDFASCSAHKFHGPKGVGFAYIRKSSHLKSSTTGGAQERSMRAGTENVYGIVGLGKAFELALNELDERKNYITELKKYTIEQLKIYIPNVKINGYGEDADRSLYTLLSVLLPFPNTLVEFKLDMNGIGVSQGSACASGAAKPSNTMAYLYSEEELQNTTTLRISFSHFNTKDEIDKLVTTLVDIQNSK